MSRRYVITDVFTDRAFGGNPLAVFLDAEGLDTSQMQSIAREMNLSETTFVTPGSGPGHFRVRIFTPAHELPFAGHPTIGTAVVLSETGAAEGQSEIVLEEAAGPVRVALRQGGATFSLDGAPERRPSGLPAEGIAAALGLAIGDLADEAWQAGYGGVAYLYVPVANKGALARSSLRADRFAAFGLWGHGVYVFTELNGSGSRTLQARAFVPGAGVAEDPATGSAAAALAGSIDTVHPNGITRLAIDQGVEMGRPSRIETETAWHEGAVTQVRVRGGAVLVSEARLLLDP